MKAEAERTLSSLKQITDFPFYSARYYGDYRLTEFASGAVEDPDKVAPFFEKLFADSGKPVKIQFPPGNDFGSGCSAFFCRDSRNTAVVGKNLDWKKDPVLLLKTSPAGGFTSLSIVNLNTCDPFRLNSFPHKLLLAPYLPMDGLNEKGLTVTMLSVQEGTDYPAESGKLSAGDFNIIRIILDTCQNIHEALDVFTRYNLMQTGPLPIHFLLADQQDSCIVEFFDGNMHFSRSRDLNYLTNFLKLKAAGCKKQRELCRRHQILEKELEKNKGNIGISEAKKLLQKVSVYQEGFQIPSTIWSVVYSPENLCMKIRVGDSPRYYSFSLREKP